MKPIIGIIMRPSMSRLGRDIKYIYDDISNAIIKSKGIPIGITNNNFFDYIDICDGFILQGGSDLENINIEIIKYLYKHDIPLLGICLGMQEMAISFSGILYDINNHEKDTLHEITINKDSLLYKILGCEKTLVNSRHKSAVKNSSLSISAISNDNVIEAIEKDDKRFFMALQWHPENMYNKEINARKIFDYFIKVCNDTK